MGLIEYLGLLAAAFVAGAINAVAGGGSLISFPALLAAGFASKTANVTNTVALWPGYAGGSYGYRSELSRQRQRFLRLAGPAILGALVGSIVLLATPPSAFDVIVPFLILFACTMMAFQDQLSRFALAHRLASHGDEHVPFMLLLSTFASADLRRVLRRGPRHHHARVPRDPAAGRHPALERAEGAPVAPDQRRRRHLLRHLRSGAMATRCRDGRRCRRRRLPWRRRRTEARPAVAASRRHRLRHRGGDDPPRPAGAVIPAL